MPWSRSLLISFLISLMLAAVLGGCKPRASAASASASAADSEEGAACLVDALSAEERSAQQAATAHVLATIAEVKELPQGYGFRLPTSASTLAETALWISREQRCCPFLTYSLRWVPRSSDVWIEAVGAPAREFLKEAFLARLAARHVPGA